MLQIKPPKPGSLPKLKDHPYFNDFMRFFDAMRAEGEMNYQALYRSCAALDPTIKYVTIYRFFKKLSDPFLAAQTVARGELRDKMKRIASATLDDVLKNPSLLSAKDRIALAKIASSEELAEIKIILDEKHKQKADNRMDFLIDKARYGDKPILEQKVEDLALPDPNTGQ